MSQDKIPDEPGETQSPGQPVPGEDPEEVQAIEGERKAEPDPNPIPVHQAPVHPGHQAPEVQVTGGEKEAEPDPPIPVQVPGVPARVPASGVPPKVPVSGIPDQNQLATLVSALAQEFNKTKHSQGHFSTPQKKFYFFLPKYPEIKMRVFAKQDWAQQGSSRP